MSYNPNIAVTGSINSVSTGRGAGSFAMTANIIGPLSHVSGRRMGIYSAQPVCTPSDGYETWTNDTLTAMYYMTHGTRVSGTYDEVADASETYFGGHMRDQGAKGCTIHYNYSIFYNQAPSRVQTRAGIPGAVTQSYSPVDGGTWSPTGDVLSGSTTTFYNYSTFNPAAVGPYNPLSYAAFTSDCGFLQLTTRDLVNPNVYLQKSTIAGTVINGYTGSITSTGEAQSGSMVGKLKLDVPKSNTSANWDLAYGYFDVLTAYPTDYVSE